MKGEIDWSLIAKKAWETRRKNSGNGEAKSQATIEVDEKLSEEDEMMMRIFRDEYVVGDEWVDEYEREMAKHMRRKELMERALGVHRENGIHFGKEIEKRKIERWNGGVKFGN